MAKIIKMSFGFWLPNDLSTWKTSLMSEIQLKIKKKGGGCLARITWLLPFTMLCLLESWHVAGFHFQLYNKKAVLFNTRGPMHRLLQVESKSERGQWSRTGQDRPDTTWSQSSAIPPQLVLGLKGRLQSEVGEGGTGSWSGLRGSCRN